MLPGPDEQGHGQRPHQLEISSTVTPVWRLLGTFKRLIFKNKVIFGHFYQNVGFWFVDLTWKV